MTHEPMNRVSKTKPKVLIVDDEIFNLRLLKLKFENAGYQVILAEDGQEGLEKFDSEHPDIIITDIKMPVMDGREMCEKLPETGEFFLIIVTSRIDEEYRAGIKEFPNRMFMEKPVSPRELVEKTNQYLERCAGKRARPVQVPSDHSMLSKDRDKGSGFQDGIDEELAHRYEELNLIYRIGSCLHLNERIDRVFADLLKETLETFDSDGGMVFFKTQHIHVSNSIFTDNGISLSSSDLIVMMTMIDDRLRRSTGPFMIRDSRNHPMMKDLPPMRILAHPILVDFGKIAGGIVLFRQSQKKEFSTGDIQLLGMLSGHASIIATNHNLYEGMKQLLFSMVESLSDAIEAKDSYSRGHTLRVSEISVALGKALLLSPQDLEHLRWGSILHDVGKVGIPEHILTKPDKLTEKEYEVMKKHPEIGYQIMSHILPLKEALAGVLHHHERFDGKGYPHGLKGKEIPLYGRILSVADAYDSMTRDRSYRQAKTHEFAIQEISRVSGEQMDPEIVGVFLKMVQSDSGFLCKIQKNAEKQESELSPS